MFLSKMVLETIRKAPNDIKIKSHELMYRAGFLKQVAVGIYSLTMPAQKMALNIEKIIRDEMNKADGQEVKFPVVMPKELWEESGRFYSIGTEMVRFKDRNNHDMLLGMTHEEAAVHLARNTVNSYNQLPCMIYQIQTKFRDEARSRGGLIRVREFTMKDAYSFHINQDDLNEYYQKIYKSYENIFKRIGLKNFISVKSDTGMMGGSVAHEFMLLTDCGEDDIIICDKCEYKANMEVAEGIIENSNCDKDSTLVEVFTGDDHEISEVINYLKMDIKNTVKAVVFAAKGENTAIICFIRGDLEVNEAKLRAVVRKNIVPMDNTAEFGLQAGNIGPYKLNVKNSIIVFDSSLKNTSNMICGANKESYHLTGLNIERDLRIDEYHDIAKVQNGNKCKICGGNLRINHGIEIGNIFQLGIKYTKAMNMTVLNNEGESVTPIMGCYGIGVGRAIASLIEESNDDKGIILPISVAPWQVHLCPLRIDDENVKTLSYEIYNNLKNMNIDVLFDDRNLSPGVKFADADLLGMPIRVVVSSRNIENSSVEISIRKNGEKLIVPISNIYNEINSIIEKLKSEIVN